MREINCYVTSIYRYEIMYFIKSTRFYFDFVCDIRYCIHAYIVYVLSTIYFRVTHNKFSINTRSEAGVYVYLRAADINLCQTVVCIVGRRIYEEEETLPLVQKNCMRKIREQGCGKLCKILSRSYTPFLYVTNVPKNIIKTKDNKHIKKYREDLILHSP